MLAERNRALYLTVQDIDSSAPSG